LDTESTSLTRQRGEILEVGSFVDVQGILEYFSKHC
jgi:hypothetical protein